MMSAEQDPNRAVDAFVSAIRNLASNDNYKIIADVFMDAQRLKTENARLASSSRDVLEEYRKFRNELEAKETKLMDDKAKLQQAMDQKDTQIQELEASNAELNAGLQNIRRQLDEESQKCLELAEKRNELEDAASNLRASLDKTTQLMSTFEGTRSTMEAELAEAKESLQSRNTELASLEAAKAEIEGQLAEVRASLDTKTTQLAAVEGTKATLDAQLAAEGLKLEDQTKEIEALSANKGTLAAELAEANRGLLDKSKELEDLSVLKSSLDAQVSELAAKMDGHTRELNDVSQAKAKLDTAIVDVEAALEDKTMEAEELTLQLAESRVNYDNKVTQVQSLESHLADVDGKLEAQSRELKELFKVKAAVDTELAEAKAQLDAERDAKVAAQDSSKAATDSLQEEAERTSILLDEVAHLRQTISDRNQQVDKLNGEAVRGNDDLSQAQSGLKKLESVIEGLERDLRTKTESLDKIDTYQVQLKHEPEETYVEILDTIWVSILDLCEHHFSQDLDPPVLRDPSCWANLRSADHLRHQAVRLPLPRSNTPAARQMRIAAVLAALSRSLARHVFRPSWAVEGPAGAGGGDADAALGALLRGLEAASPDHERHLRGALLAAAVAVHPARGREAKKEEEEEEGGDGGRLRVPRGPWKRRAAAVVREVTFLVQHLLSALQYGAFREGLEACVALACDRWAEVQGAAMKIEPYFGPPYDDFDWQVLMLPEEFGDGEGEGLGGGQGGGSTLGLDAGSGTIGGSPRGLPPAAAAAAAAAAAQDAVVSTPSPSASSSAAAAAPRDNQDDASTIAESVRSVVDPADIMLVLWPTMCAVEGGELVSITQGLVMAKSQAAAAFEEEGRRRRPGTNGGKRARSMSLSRSGAAAGTRHSGKAVLAQAKREREREGEHDGGSAGSGSRNASRNGSLAAVD
ncbi:putative mei5 protein [Diaporthe ampelina]|uniref:Putative mei5 protein n=1 Tax=Diaporthe ampelina TaxID=1214573 RepID=A0A0G2FZR8_9PEZI|nr:putative mei5 protein [Diaporthe ampelina]